MRPRARAAATDGGTSRQRLSGMMAAVHRAENGTTCLGCQPTVRAEIGEGMSWITGSYEVLNTQTGQQVVPEKSLEDLVAARGIEPDQFCLNESCHNMTRDDLIQATKNLERNPHVAQHGEKPVQRLPQGASRFRERLLAVPQRRPHPRGLDLRCGQHRLLEKELQLEQAPPKPSARTAGEGRSTGRPSFLCVASAIGKLRLPNLLLLAVAAASRRVSL